MAKQWFKFLLDNNEMLAWTAGLVILALNGLSDSGYGLCIFKAAGLGNWCPGCGLGHAIAYLLRGDLVLSLKAHPFGIPGFFILAGRVAYLAKRSWNRRQNNFCRI